MISQLAFIGNMGGWEVLVILMVLLIFFGAKKIPELARGLGRGIREFKDATSEIKREIEDSSKEVTRNDSSSTSTTNESSPSKS